MPGNEIRCMPMSYPDSTDAMAIVDVKYVTER